MTFEVSKNLEGLYCYADSLEAAFTSIQSVQRLETQDSDDRNYLATTGSVFREAYPRRCISNPSRCQNLKSFTQL